MSDTLQPKIAVLGAAGAIGKATVRALTKQSISVRVVGRNLSRLQDAFGSLEHRDLVAFTVADLMKFDEIVSAIEGVQTAILCAGAPYPEFERHPAMMGALLDAVAVARKSNKCSLERVVLVTNIYPYGKPQGDPVTEQHPREPCSKKGRLRLQQENMLLEAHAQGLVRGLVLRLPDFYGPDADLSIVSDVFTKCVTGATCTLVGDATKPHEFLFAEDAGPVVAALATGQDGLYGEVYHLAGSGRITTLDFAKKAYEIAGKPLAYRQVGSFLCTLVGLFNPIVREVKEMLYLQSEPLFLSDEKLQAALGKQLQKTSYEDGIKLTVEASRGKVK